ncbi:PilZ domain-containing protein [Marinobacter daepoensis]|uniref:PilZ domain-containing protein n=1 Tax=Marinobacter daepoensis TaxID=262077 RepID=A0ABS3BD43_9GAMM|nr:PilZ domain-containing protein [Marinobacter daepoensis]MBN7769511.1 PilZ domain-containing protein [Marinobacter daepoensis]MBY6031828.1 PilZ domain-containing protein [Marinobacter daepoensis]MBY6078201.1 PilZ domain-containing protein [Marinobacter daepoensis]
MKDYSEKRDFHRMQVDSTLVITDDQGNTFQGVCKDLSAAGMQISVDHPFAIGDELKTRMESAGDQFPALETVCEVVRCKPDGERYLLGINIIEVMQ